MDLREMIVSLIIMQLTLNLECAAYKLKSIFGTAQADWEFSLSVRERNV